MLENTAIIISVCAVLLTMYQGYLQRKGNHEQVFIEFISMWLKTDQIFIDKPYLRPYFYSDQEIEQGDENYEEVMALAEMFDDVFTYSYNQAKYIPQEFNISYRRYREKVMSMRAFKMYKKEYQWINNTERGDSAIMSIKCKILIGLIGLVSTLLFIYLNYRQWKSNPNVDSIVLVVLVVASCFFLILFLFGLIDLWEVTKENKMNTKQGDFVFQKEYSEYNIMVSQSHDYSKWKNSTENNFNKIKNDDLRHLLESMVRNRIEYKELWSSLVIPLELVAFGAYCTRDKFVCLYSITNFISFLAVIVLGVFLIFSVTKEIMRANKEIYFLEDFIQVVFTDKT